ncbi:MAG: VOC family protein [Candidatus Competibacteraceae bacterium]|nr:VOC family protein [Candidatus Competibacteraceae bacterium]
MAQFKPSGYTTVSPYLIVADAAATIRFLETVLGGKLLRSFPDDQGRLMHAEVKIDDTVVMLADSAPEWQPVAAYAHVYVKDVDATSKRALAEGATSVQVPEKKEDEDKRGGVKDAGGTTWWIATRVE